MDARTGSRAFAIIPVGHDQPHLNSSSLRDEGHWRGLADREEAVVRRRRAYPLLAFPSRAEMGSLKAARPVEKFENPSTRVDPSQIGGVRSPHLVARSYASARASTTGSPNRGPLISSPMGSPLRPKPHGIDMLGKP